LPSTLETLSPTRVKLTIVIPFAELKPALDKAYRAIAAQITIPGFRKGKVPPAVINQRVGRAAVLSEAVNDVLPNAYGAAIVEHKLTPLAPPEITVVSLEDGQDATFDAEVDIRPDFDLPKIDAIAVTVKPATVDDTAVDERIALLRERFAETKEVERAAEKGDQVTLDLVATQQGEPLADASADGVTYVIGSGGMLDGLDEAVTGLKAGQQKTFTSTLVGGEHEGEEADIAVSVTKVAERTLPEVDDDFAQLVSSFDTAEAMKQDLRQGAERMALYEQADEARGKIIDAILAATPFELPPAIVKAQVEARTDQINQMLQRANLTLAEYLERSGQGQTPEEFWGELEKAADRSIRTQVVLDKVAEATAVKVSQEDVTRYLFERAQENGTSPQEELQHMTEHDHLGEWMAEIRRAKALNQVMRQAKVKDSDGKKVDLASLFPEPPAGEADAEGEGVEVVDIV
jgi:trigger factor